MWRWLSLTFLGATAGCFLEVPAEVGTETNASTGSGTGTSTGAGSSEDTGNGGTDPSVSTVASADDSSDTTDGTDGDSGTTGSTGLATGSESGTTGPTVCPTFFDAFDDGVEDSRWLQGFGSSSTEADGELSILVTGELNDEYVTMVVQPEGGGLEGGTMRLELGITPVDVGVRTTLWVQPIEHPGRISYNLVDRGAGPRLEARLSPKQGNPLVAAAIDWEPAMGWSQLREAEGTLYFETSGDGVTFEVFHEMATPFDLGLAEVGFAGHNDLALEEDVVVSIRTFEFICG